MYRHEKLLLLTQLSKATKYVVYVLWRREKMQRQEEIFKKLP